MVLQQVVWLCSRRIAQGMHLALVVLVYFYQGRGLLLVSRPCAAVSTTKLVLQRIPITCGWRDSFKVLWNIQCMLCQSWDKDLVPGVIHVPKDAVYV